MKISVSELDKIAKERFALDLPGYVDETLFRCILRGEEFAEVPDTFPADVERVRQEYERKQTESVARQLEYDKVSELRLRGMEKEKAADNAGAISEFAIAIALGEQSRFNLFSAYGYAYERLIVCLHKAKDYEREAKYIEQYLSHGLDERKAEKYQSRLAKLKNKK